MYLASLGLRLATIGPVGPRPDATRVAGACVARVQLQAFDASVGVALVQVRDGS